MVLLNRPTFAAVVLLIRGGQAGHQAFRPFPFVNSSTIATEMSTLLATTPSSTDISSSSASIAVNTTTSLAAVASTEGMAYT